MTKLYGKESLGTVEWATATVMVFCTSDQVHVRCQVMDRPRLIIIKLNIHIQPKLRTHGKKVPKHLNIAKLKTAASCKQIFVKALEERL
ncbi:hypothetical protein DPMN_154731 [Dreissena polymorpha]|uniref:Uncharacterized protein n=1 Tax=Dreissena polymorpha TaxID=45954 RepID=A0A9D4FQI6_DREPO|nr:hypothetical protein DPMN_154731 [Dreissena polymorpha]